MISQEEIDRLSSAERLALIERLWDSLPDAEVPLTNAQQQELQRRLETFDQEKSKSVTWEEIKAGLDARKR